jgi:hypothetical protein
MPDERTEILPVEDNLDDVELTLFALKTAVPGFENDAADRVARPNDHPDDMARSDTQPYGGPEARC